MITVGLVCLWGATVFIGQDLPGLSPAPPDPLSGHVSINLRRVDLDGDGAVDLVFPERVVFQRDGLFSVGAGVDLPIHSPSPEVDVFDDNVFFRYPDSLEVYRWSGEAWVLVLSQEADWREPVATGESAQVENAGPGRTIAQFRKFLHDFNSDGIPEIIQFRQDGVHVYRRSVNRYEHASLLDVYPPFVQANRQRDTVLWPPDKRVVSFPDHTLQFQTVFDESSLSVITRTELSNGRVLFQIARYKIGDEFLVRPEATEVSISKPFPAEFEAVQLNDEPTIEFAGGLLTYSNTSPFPIPFFEVAADFGGANGIQSVRTKSFRPRSQMLDFDGDGDSDVIAHRSGLLSGGLRETLNGFFFQRTIEHEVAIYFQEDGRFTDAHFDARKFTIQLDEVPFREGDMFRRYRQGDLVDLSGDFNGDGIRDLVYQASSNQLAIYYARSDRFSKSPIHWLDISDRERFYISDVDGNGLSDIILVMPDEETGTERTRVLFAKETTP